MEREGFDLGAYLRKGVEKIVKGALKATASDPAESAYMARFAVSSLEASRKRAKAEERGEHIPPFLIASITATCNLHCAGCYSWQFQGCSGEPSQQMSASEWERIFSQARQIGVSFILLAGGEPLLRRDVIEAAGRYPEILFPVFTNGTLLDEGYMKLFDEKRNLLPVFSIEGQREKTDGRRGEGVYDRVNAAMEKIRSRHLFFGVSVTMTTDNLKEITGEEFLEDLGDRGCKVVIYVEFVPVSEDTSSLAPGKEEREYLQNRLNEIREKYPSMVFISFPGDEKSSGGCLAAGRGFFHINAHGGAEPCPFSPYSDTSVRDTSLLEALHSPLFTSLREENLLMEDHQGGCVLFERRETVENLLNGESTSKP